jgi:hypothetical protein
VVTVAAVGLCCVFEGDDTLYIFAGENGGLGELDGDADVGVMVHSRPTCGGRDLRRSTCVVRKLFRDSKTEVMQVHEVRFGDVDALNVRLQLSRNKALRSIFILTTCKILPWILLWNMPILFWTYINSIISILHRFPSYLT